MIKYFAFFVALVAILFGAYYLVTIKSDRQTAMEPQPAQQPQGSSVQVVALEHATGILRWGGTNIYFDPVGDASVFASQPPAHIILVTDIHGDHLSTSSLASVLGGAKLIVPQAVKDMLPTDLQRKAQVLANGESITEQGFSITAIPMYNLPSAANKDRHVKGRGNGYLLEKDGTRVYIAGDTAGTPEMRGLTAIDIALIPMNPTFTMSVEEAADAVLAFKPREVHPYHYRDPNGLSDVEKFRQLVNAGDPSIKVVLDAWYPAQ